MNTQDLKNLIEKFELLKINEKYKFDEFEKLQSKFVNDFRIKNIEKLSLDEYIIGKGNKNSFCYRIERELAEIGNMRGSRSNIFVVYFGKNGKDVDYKYRFTKKLGNISNENEALKAVKKEIISLIVSGKTNDVKSIYKNKLADLFKYKILGTYYPDNFINIYSKNHFDYFLGELGINPVGKTIIDKQISLLKFKNEDESMKYWSNYEFNRFLYYYIGYPPSDKDFLTVSLPPIEDIKAEEIQLEFDEAQQLKAPNKNIGVAKPNYEEIHERNNRLGKRGENIVYNFEKDFLNKNGLDVNEVEHSSLNDDRLGYDIKSIELDKTTKYIEVKSTRNSVDNTTFYLTENERIKGEELQNYYIYIVYEAHTKKPKIWKIRNPFQKINKSIKLEPTNYRVTILTKK